MGLEDLYPSDKMPKRFWLVVIGLAVLTLLVLFSPRRDAEVALGVKWLPWSARDLNVSVDAWTDYVVTGYLVVSPSDFESIVNSREYERTDHPAWEISDPRLPDAIGRASTTTYLWSNGSSDATLESDVTRAWIQFSYSTH